MKKKYQRPELYYESFALCSTIAAGCEGIANFAENACTVTLEGEGYKLVLFNSNTVCLDSPPNADDYLCYHAPTENNNIFSS